MVSAMGESRAADRLVWACWMIAAGGLLLGLQRQATGEFVGTGLRSLGLGALVAVAALVLTFLTVGRSAMEPRLPRDLLGALSSAAGFFGLTFLVSAVLLPGGSWMFVEAVILVLVLSRGDGGRGQLSFASGPSLRQGVLLVLALFLALRLWVTWQGAHHRWAAIELDIPIAAQIGFLPERLRTLSLGEFSATEFGFPRVGLDFDATLALWAAGFALVAGGLWLRHKNAFEVEGDRIQDTIEALPPQLAVLVQRVLPEEEWARLGLHGLGERQRRKRIAALTEDRMRRAIDFHELYQVTALPPSPGSEFGQAIQSSFQRYRSLAAGVPADPASEQAAEFEVVERSPEPPDAEEPQ